MADVKELLNKIWGRFRNAGIANEDLIIEHLAALLTEDYEQPPDPDLQLRKQTVRRDLNLDEIKQLLDEAVDNVDETLDMAGKKAALFDRHILFRPQQIRNGYYPTPRHIAQYMRRLVQLKKEHTLVDFACGSGGLLVERIDPEQRPRELIGIDISPDRAKLAWANTRLHGETRAKIIVKDALRAMKEDWHGKRFECILMNPPFGGTINAELAKEVVDYETTSDSTVALTALTLHALAEEGRAVILVPNGILFRGTSGPAMIRDLLVSRDEDGNFHGAFDLEAIISLPPDALKPFSSISTHILLIKKRKVDHKHQQNTTWFFRPSDDGYESGNRRDVLTTQPKEPNELTLVEHVLQRYVNKQKDDLYLPEENQLLVRKNTTLENMSPSILIEAINGSSVSHVVHCPQRETMSAFFLIEFTQPDNEQGTYYIQVPINQDGTIQAQPIRNEYASIRNGEERNKLLQRLYNVPRERDVPLSNPLMEEGCYARAITLAHGNSLLGVAVPTRGIMPSNLQPSQYVKTLSETRISEPPAILLGRVRRKQTAFLQQVDGLLGRLDLPPITGLELPSPLAQEKDPLTDQEKEISPFSDISKEQLQVWRRICAIVERHNDKNGLFSMKDIVGDGVGEEMVRLTIELFEWMGVIVPVTIVDPIRRESIKTPLYRRVTERDLWDQEQKLV